MKKIIRVKEKGVIKDIEMTIGDTFIYFEGYLKKQAYLSKQIITKQDMTEEDIFQIYSMTLIKAYNMYDFNKGNLFITLLTWCIKGVKANLNRYSHNEIRFNGDAELSLDYTYTGKDNETDSLMGTLRDDFNLEQTIIDSEIMEKVSSMVKSDEERDMLRVVIYRKEFSVEKFSNKYGISRQGGAYRIKNFQEKLKKLLTKEYRLLYNR